LKKELFIDLIYLMNNSFLVYTYYLCILCTGKIWDLWRIKIINKQLPVLSRDRLEPCRLGGLLPGRLCGLLAGLLAGRLAGRLPVSPTFDFLTAGVDGFLTTEVLEWGDDSLSLSESGVPAVRFTPILPIGTLLELRSRT